MIPTNTYLIAVALVAMTAVITQIEQTEGGEIEEIDILGEEKA